MDEAARCREILGAVSFSPADYGALLRPDWAKPMGCQVVPAESGARLPPAQILLVPNALRRRGYDQCYAIPSEPLGPSEGPLAIGATPDEFARLNERYGLFRFVIVSADRAWAIACNEWFNLFGAPPGLLAEMLGRSPVDAERDFEAFATRIGGSLPKVSRMYRRSLWMRDDPTGRS